MSNTNNNPSTAFPQMQGQQQQQQQRHDDCPVVRAQQQEQPYAHLITVDEVLSRHGYTRIIQQKQMGVRHNRT